MSINYRVPILDKFEWQRTVKDKDLTSPPGSPVKGDRYIVKATGTGSWSGHDNDITYYDSSNWQFITPTEGYITWVSDEDNYYYYTGSNWVTFASLPSVVDEFYVEVMG